MGILKPQVFAWLSVTAHQLRASFPLKYGFKDPLLGFTSEAQRNPFFPECLVLITRPLLPRHSGRALGRLAFGGSSRGSEGSWGEKPGPGKELWKQLTRTQRTL